MTDNKNNRRKLLKSIAVGSGAVVAGKSLPESWVKPVVSSVVLPSHANTSAALAEPSLCSVDIAFDVTLSGSYTGDGGFDIDDSTCTRVDSKVISFPGVTEFSYDLAPGTYYFSGSGAFGSENSGTGNMRIEVACCNELEFITASASGPLNGDSAGMSLQIVIGDDGTCSITPDVQIPC